MKIVFLTTGIYPVKVGGIQKHSLLLIKHLVSHDVNLKVYYPKSLSDEGSFLDKFSPQELSKIEFIAIQRREMKRFPLHYLMEELIYSYSLHKAVSYENFDIIYAQGFTSFTFVFRRWSGPMVTNMHGLDMFQRAASYTDKLKTYHMRLVAKFIVRRSKSTLSMGGGITQLLTSLGVNADCIKVIPNGVDLVKGDLCRSIEGPLRFVFIGRNDPRKGLGAFLTALTSLRHTSHFRVDIIGPHSIDCNDSRLTYHGLITDFSKISKILLEADVLVNPSLAEGMPTVVLEAMSHGCAIIATDVGATSELVDESNGILLSIDDLAINLSDSLEIVLAMDKNTLEQKKANSRKKIKNRFTWKRVAMETIKHLESQCS